MDKAWKHWVFAKFQIVGDGHSKWRVARASIYESMWVWQGPISSTVLLVGPRSFASNPALISLNQGMQLKESVWDVSVALSTEFCRPSYWKSKTGAWGVLRSTLFEPLAAGLWRCSILMASSRAQCLPSPHLTRNWLNPFVDSECSAS